MKDAYYFPHDSNAQNDIKILELRSTHGWVGYGIFFAILERMRDCPDYKITKSSILGLSIALSIDVASLQQILETCFTVGLFNHDDKFFWSDSFIRRMLEIEDKRKKYKEAGRLGGIATASLRHRSSKERKGKERKIINSASAKSIPECQSIKTENPTRNNNNDPEFPPPPKAFLNLARKVVKNVATR